MTTQLKIEKLERIRNYALQSKRELHNRRYDSLYSEEYNKLGKVIDQANAAIFELDVKLEIEKI
tara:strand:- start:894 stop:1085 length:192 start_codon:yes stop_codon:yes gene_type:complete